MTIAGGNRYLGYFSGIDSDRRLRVSRSSTRKGLGIGLTTGAVTAGSLSLLWGIALTSLDEGDDSFADVLGFAIPPGPGFRNSFRPQ